MTAVGTKLNKRSLAWFVALATFFSLVIPLVAATPAWAAHNTLDVTPETDENATGETHTLTATLTNTTGTPDNNNGVGYEVDFEIDCTTDCSDAEYAGFAGAPAGGPTTAPEAGVEGDQNAGTTDDVRTTPELSCSIAEVPANGSAQCTVSYTRNDGGSDEVAGWVDLDRNNTSDESDGTENVDGTGGTITEPDSTDVVAKQWFEDIPANATLDCDDENPDNGDSERNLNGQSETYTCTVTTPDGPDTGGDPDPVSGVNIDAEQAGANDPDNSGLNTAGTVDYDNACVTGADGSCTFTLNQTENELGSADVCFFVDGDNDNTYDPTDSGDPNDANDGSQCPEAVDAPENDNRTDQVQKTWVEEGEVTSLDATPEVDNNPSGSSHTVTATVTDEFGQPASGVPVDFNVPANNDNGSVTRNPGLKCDNVATNSSGVATCTYSDGGTTTTDGQDSIDACVDAEAAVGASCDDGVEARDADDENSNTTDRVAKFWTAGGAEADEVVIDMEIFNTGCDNNQADAQEEDTNSAGESHDLCATVLNEGQAVPGAEVTFEKDGPGTFVAPGSEEDFFFATDVECGEASGEDSFTTTTDESGEAFASLCSEETGDIDVTATSLGATSVEATKTYEGNDARNIDCEPEDATNQTGTQHLIECTVTDRFGNPTDASSGQNDGSDDDGVQFELTGVGRISGDNDGDPQSEDLDVQDDGTVDLVIETAPGEEGETTVDAELESDEGDDDDADDTDDDCDQLANEPNEGDPAGNCEDQVAKTWDDSFGQTECNDGIDNDGDGFTDFPDDPECDSPEDDREAGGPTTGPCSQEGAIVGTENDDALTGTEGDDLICGLAGDDLIDGLGGEDLILGGADDDTISGGQGPDDIRGQGGNDVVSGNGGKDQITGGAGDDTLSGNGGNDIVSGGVGGDSLKGNKGIDTLRGKKGADTLQGGRGDDILRGGKGRDLLRGFTGDDFLDGGKGIDTCGGGRGNDVIIRCERRL